MSALRSKQKFKQGSILTSVSTPASVLYEQYWCIGVISVIISSYIITR